MDNQPSPLILGFDIGGTKTTAVLGTFTGQIVAWNAIPTPADQPFEVALARMVSVADQLIADAQERGGRAPEVISVAVGGPLDIERGIIYSPPHLPTWEAAPLKERLEEYYHLPVYVEHDGNAGALAEFYFGAGRGYKNLVYLTMGTGLGAGIILDGRIYHGTSDTAGEVGHMRIAEHGPLEYGKQGSWESYCSGAGLVKLAQLRDPERWSATTTTQEIIQQALEGDAHALTLVTEMSEWFGKGLAVLVDILNPQVIVVGTLGIVLGDLLLEKARQVMREEALTVAASACQVVPAGLGDALGKVAALMGAIDAYQYHRLQVGAPAALLQVIGSLRDGLDVRKRTVQELAEEITLTAQLILQCLQNGGKVLACGNGGSAAAAQHLAGELVGRFKGERQALPAIALSADSNVVTCIGNDYGFDELFARQVRAFAGPGDILIGFTTSGRSPNVLRALQTGRELGITTVALTGENGLAEPVADHILPIPSALTARIQEEHEAILHAWCEVIETAFR